MSDPADSDHSQAPHLFPRQRAGGSGERGQREQLPGLWAFFGAAQIGNVVGDADDRDSLGPSQIRDREREEPRRRREGLSRFGDLSCRRFVTKL
ncbi:hypothetical protein MRB53_014419 [Persea americana]|uniref:Uncharacterized protein n=1 Tax=Persea americana TaxID=3435 RepID=A0ACC2KAS8_PERAE|nr:hypothetical protein MRB53_014419 [Persea americana]